jgi:hypothetical protein
MTEPRTTPILLNAAGEDLTIEPRRVGREGLELTLHIEQGDVLDEKASLRLLSAPGPSPGMVEEEVLDQVHYSSNQGPFVAQAEGTSVAWIAADWGAERPLCRIRLKLKEDSTTIKAKVRIFVSGVWLPLTPTDIVDTGKEQSFPPVMAGKLMAELVVAGEHPGVWKAAAPAAVVTSLGLWAATLPQDLSLGIEGQGPLLRWTGLLPLAGLEVDGLAAAVNACLDKPGALGPVRLRLEAGTAGRIRFDFCGETVKVVRQLTAPADGLLRLTWQDAGTAAATGRLELEKGARITALSFAVEPRLQLVHLERWVEKGAPGLEHYCTPADCLAQGLVSFKPLPPLIGLDIPVRPRGAGLRGTLALHPDHHGRPGPQPYAGTVLPVAWPAGADAHDPQGWLSLDFARPLQLPDPLWWVVLTLDEGEAFWPLRPFQPLDTDRFRASACLYRRRDEAWLPRPQVKDEAVWAVLRLRLAAPDLRPAFQFGMKRGAVTVVVKPDVQGRVRLDAGTLDRLNTAADQLEIIATANCAGSLRVLDLRLMHR